MSNPHLDARNLTILDRVLLFFAWAIVGFVLAYFILLNLFESLDSITFPLVFSMSCGAIAAIWPKQIKHIAGEIWDAIWRM